MFLVKCPKCNQTMNCQPRTIPSKAVKKCVYCGRSFKIHSNPKESRIIKKL